MRSARGSAAHAGTLTCSSRIRRSCECRTSGNRANLCLSRATLLHRITREALQFRHRPQHRPLPPHLKLLQLLHLPPRRPRFLRSQFPLLPLRPNRLPLPSAMARRPALPRRPPRALPRPRAPRPPHPRSARRVDVRPRRSRRLGLQKSSGPVVERPGCPRLLGIAETSTPSKRMSSSGAALGGAAV